MKKALSLALALVLVLGMSVTSFAAISLSSEPAAGYNGFANLVGANGQYVNPELTPGSNSKAYKIATKAFNVTFSDLTNDVEKDAQAHLNTSDTATSGYVKKALPKVVARTRIAKGSNVIDKIELNFTSGKEGVAQLEVKFVTPFKNNNPDGQEYDIWVFPVVDGKSWDYEKYGVNFAGTYKNESFTVDAQTDYADLYTGYIAKIDANVRNVKFDLGSDITVIAKGYKGQKFWGKANQDVSEKDLENMDKYNILAVYHLSVLGGLDKSANNVVIAGTTKDDYIFDGELKFLGMGDAKNIPFAETYYVADKMIEVASEEEPTEVSTDEETDPLALAPQTGGTVSAPSGLFDNPSTGA
jgi:hypothetical protein